MKRPRRIFLRLLFVCGVALTACQSSVPPVEGPTPALSVIGMLKPWTAGAPIANRQVTLCRSQGDPREGICDLLERSVTTDGQGRFQFYDLPAGIYFVLYDSGLSDFDQAMARWGGETLHFGDQEWLSDFLGVDLSGDNLDYRLPEGISLSPNASWLSTYCVLTLSIGQSPFIIAHDLESASHDRELHCAVIEVLPGQTVKVDLEVVYFGDQ